jgi:LysM repeat protein
VNWDSPPPVELPTGGVKTSAPAATALNAAPAGAPAPRFSPGVAGAARLDAPTDSVAGTPMKPSADAANAAPIEPPASYPKTNTPPGAFDAAGSAPIAPTSNSYPTTDNASGPALPGVSITPTQDAGDKVTPTSGSVDGHSLSMPNALTGAPAMAVAWNEINTLVTSKPAEALDRLSRSFDDLNLSAEENRRVTESLDQLAGTVVYSREHLLAPAHVVQPGERLDQIATKYNLTPELLAKINGIADPANLAPGTQLKVMPGPFGALIDKSRRQLSVFLGGLYAGSFNVGFGQDQAAADGYYKVAGKTFDPSRSLYVLDLGNGVTMHTSLDGAPLNNDQARGCIRLDPAQAADVFDILSVGSDVIVRP